MLLYGASIITMDKYKKIITLMHTINTSMSLQSLLSSIMDAAKEILNCEGASLLLYDFERDELIFDVVVSEKGEIIQGKRLGVGQGIAGYVAYTRESVIVNDVMSDDRFNPEIDRMSGFTTRQIIAVPVKIKERFVGVLEAVNSRGSNGFTNSDMEILTHIADAAAIAVNNHELVISLKNRVEELTCIYEISQSIYFTFKIEEFLLKILHAVNRVIKADRCSFMITDETGKRVKYFVSTKETPFKIELEDTIMSQVIKTGDPLLVYNIDDNFHLNVQTTVGKNDGNPGSKKSYRSRSFICVPMKYLDRVIGVLNVTDKNTGGIFDSFDLRVLSTVANHVAETYENVQLQSQSFEMERLDRELQIAADIQAHSFSMVPAVEGASIGAFVIPSSYVSGDFYDIRVLDRERFACAIGDVSGKGISAAIFMNTIRNALHFESMGMKNPEEMLCALNRWACRESHHGMFCTMFYCVAERNSRELKWLSAGHNAQFYYNASTGILEQITASGKPLGIVDDEMFEVRGRAYAPGDLLVMYSDGLMEKDASSRFTYEEFTSLIKKNSGREAEDLVMEIKNQILRRPDVMPEDDCTIMAIKFT